MNNGQSYDKLISCLAVSELSELDLDGNNQIIIKEKLKEGENPSPIDPEKITKIKELFLKSIQTEMPGVEEFSIEASENKKEELALGKKKLLFLEKIEKSALVEQLFSSKEDFITYVQLQKINFEKTIQHSTEKFRQFTVVASSNQIKCVKYLGWELINLNAEKSLKRQIAISIEEMETRDIIQKMIPVFDKQMPELNKKLEVLSFSDHQLCYLALSNNFRSCILDWDKINLNNKYGNPNGSQIRQDIKLFMSMCDTINRMNDPNLRDLLKQIIFTNRSWNEMTTLVSGNEEDLMQVGILIKKLNDRDPAILSRWLTPLLRATQDLSDRIEKLLSALQVLTECEKCPEYSSNIAVLKQIELIQREPAFSRELLAIPFRADYLLDMLEVIPLDQMKSVVSMLVRMPEQIFSNFMCAFTSNRIMSPKKIVPSERVNLIPVLLKISNLQVPKAEQVLISITKWIESAPVPFICQSHRLFLREPIDETLREADLILNILKECNYDSEKSLEKLKNQDFSLYSALFELPKNHWQVCNKILETKDPELSKKFNNWVKNLARLKEDESWENHMAKTTPDFQQRIAKLFELEGHNFSLFQEILESIVKDKTTRTMVILGDIYNYFPAGNLIALLEQLKIHPEIAPNLTKVFHRGPEFYEGLGNFSSIWSFIRNMAQMDAQTLTCILKGEYISNFDSTRLNDMMKTYEKDPEKLKCLMKIETPTLIVWKRGDHDTYSMFDIERMKILETYPLVKEKASKSGINSIPWDDIPDEMWNHDHDLPLQLKKIKFDLRVYGESLHNLLLGAILEGKEALAYRLIALSNKGYLTKEIFTLMAESVPGDPVVKAYAQLFEESTPEKIIETLSFLQEKEWVGFNHMLIKIEAMFAFPSNCSLEERLQKLPIRWKFALIRLMQMGRSQKEIIEPLLNFIQENPQPVFIEFLFKVLNENKSLPALEIIQLFNRFPKEDWSLDKSYEESTMWGFSELLKEWFSKYQNKDSTAIAHLLMIPGSINGANKFLLKDPDLFFSMIEMDRRMGSPYGNFISWDYTTEMHTLIASNSEVADTIKQVGLKKFSVENFKKLGNLYLRMLKINPDHPGIQVIINSLRCMDAIKHIKWESFAQPQAFIERMMELVPWSISDSLDILLESIEHHDAKVVEALFDMARAGYIPEAVTILQELEKSPKDAKYLRLLKMAGSINAVEIQRELLNLPKITASGSVEWHKSNAVPSIFKERIEKVKTHTFKSDGDKKNAIETECSFALALAMIQQDSTFIFFPIEDLLNYAEIPLESDYAMNLKQTLEYYATDFELASKLNQVGVPPKNSPIAQMIRCHFKLDEEEELTQWHSKVAVLSAELSRPRQSAGVGSCFAVAWNNTSQSSLDGHKNRSLPDYISLIADNGLTRKSLDNKGLTFQFPAQLMPKRMQEPMLLENLFVKTRENVLASMAGNSKSSHGCFTSSGLLTKNIQTFDSLGIYGKKIDILNQELLVVEAPLKLDVICDQLKDSFSAMFKAVVEYEIPHPVTENLGWTRLARRDTSAPILDLKSYQLLQLEVLEDAKKNLIMKHPEQTIYLQNLFDQLMKYSQSNEAVDEIVGLQSVEKMKGTPWYTDFGGSGKGVVMADAQFVGDFPFVECKPKSAEEMISSLFNFYTSIPDREKENFMREPLRLHLIQIPGHMMCLVPSHMLEKMSAGKTCSEIVAEFKQPSGIFMHEIDQKKREEWMNGWIGILPMSIQAPFKLAMASQEIETMSLEACGQAMMKAFLKFNKFEPNENLLIRMENKFFELLSPEMQKRIPFLIVGDFNWDKRDYNNYYLASGCSPLTGKLTYYHCKRNGTERSQYKNINSIEIMKPISRQEEGHLTYISLKK